MPVPLLFELFMNLETGWFQGFMDCYIFAVCESKPSQFGCQTLCGYSWSNSFRRAVGLASTRAG